VADDPRVQQLLNELLDSNCTPEAVCRDCPELLPEVLQQWQKLRVVEAQIEALFPTPRLDRRAPDSCRAGTDLPRIPGYDVEEMLGRGGMGIVYKARHKRLNRFVALKMLITGVYAGPHERARFQREAEVVASLRHPNVVQVYDVGDHDGCPYFTMELLEGGTLAQALSGTPQTSRHAATLLTTLAEAMQAAHQGGIVHRDLKPANILLTADRTLKIADFGVARHFNEEAALTLSGARIGTPSYMAPEQVLGKSGTIGPAADIYALGALLYEMLAGRPPFRAETATETERQVIADEPVPPAQLNPKVPRDLETICLKCLHKDSQRRYLTAAALAADLKRFQRNEPIAARRAGRLERTVKWVRRHPTTAAMLAAIFLLVIILLGGSLWLAVQQARRRDGVNTDLKELAGLQQSARWAEARAALARAEDRLDGGRTADLRQRLGRARRDLDLVIQLDAIRLNRLTRGELAFYKARANRDYAEAFAQAGLGASHDEPSLLASRINASAVHGALVTAVYDWAVCAGDKVQRRWLLEVARRTDDRSGDWRERVLDPAVWEDKAALAELARTAPVRSESLAILLAFGERLRAAGDHSDAFLRRVQSAHPADFWANLIAGNAMLQSAPLEAAGFYRAALASRPQAPVGYCAVGDTLRLQNLPDQAIDYYQKALQIDPSYARAYSNLGAVLQDQGQLDDAIGHFRKALQLDPDYAWAHRNFASALRTKGRLDEAYEHYQQVLRLDPQNPLLQHEVACVLVPQGRGAEALIAWRTALNANRHSVDAWSGYPELCLFLRHDDEYRDARRTLLERYAQSSSTSIAEPVSRACSLLPGTDDERQKAAALADRAIAAKDSTPPWIYRYFLFAKALTAYRQGQLASAISLLEGEASKVMGPAPRLVLAMALHDQGNQKQARKALAKAVVAFDWHLAHADSQDVWIAHILRREAEALILPNLQAFLRGEYQPLDDDERLALLGVCQFQGRYHAAARLFAHAIANKPAVAEDLVSECRSRSALGDAQPVGRLEDLATECRYPAARCAALAGCGLGEDAAKLDEMLRARWRRQARDWLRADLAVWSSVLDSGSTAARALVRKKLARWQLDPDLAGLREARAVDKFSSEERQECIALWEAVSNLLGRARAGKPG
jgi:eukaryotic-like serine/threonine-protein kinase